MSKQRIEEIINAISEHNGDVEAVADELMKDLNVAVTKWNDTSKETDAQKLADHFNAFITVHYPNSKIKYNAKMIIDVMEFESKFSKVNTFSDILDVFCDSLEDLSQKKDATESKTLEEMIEEKGW